MTDHLFFEEFYAELTELSLKSVFRNHNKFVAKFAKEEWGLTLAYILLNKDTNGNKITDENKIKTLAHLFSYPTFFMNVPQEFFLKLASIGPNIIFFANALRESDVQGLTPMENFLNALRARIICLQTFAANLGANAEHFAVGVHESGDGRFLDWFNASEVETFFQFLGPHIADYICGLGRHFHFQVLLKRQNIAVWSCILDNWGLIFEKLDSARKKEFFLKYLCELQCKDRGAALMRQLREGERAFKFAQVISPLAGEFAIALQQAQNTSHFAMALDDKIVDFLRGLGDMRQQFFNSLSISLRNTFLEQEEKYAGKKSRFQINVQKIFGVIAQCAYCHSELTNVDTLYECNKCGSLQHEECWKEHRRCVSLGCKGKLQIFQRTS